jgi:tetratricopeptide (TPR) repeat protein
MKKIIVCLICIFVFASHISAIAEIKTFIKEYTYQASEIDSKVSSRAIALEQVKRLLLEELGTYLEGQTEVKNYQLTKEQITSITAGIVQTKIIDEKWNGKEYWLKAKITADPKNVAKAVDSLRKDRQRIRDLGESSKTTSKALKEAERIKKEISSAQKTDKAKIKQYNKVMDELRAEEWFQKSVSLHNAGKRNEATTALNKAIELAQDSKIAGKYYFARGILHFLVYKDYDQLIKDLNKVIKLNPEMGTGEYYALRGAAYSENVDYEKAIQDLDKAIAMGCSQQADAYAVRGYAYYALDNPRKAIFDYKRAIT